MDLKEIQKDAVKDQEPTGHEKLLQLMERWQEAKEKVGAAEDELAHFKKILRTLEEEEIPEYFDSIGAGEGSKLTADKFNVTVKKEVKAHINLDNFDQAYLWLYETGNEGIVKPQIVLKFDKGQVEQAEAAMYALNGLDFAADVELKHTVHPMTLNSFVKEQLESGSGIPMDLFGVRSTNKAIVKVK